jgi:hypothetical protein
MLKIDLIVRCTLVCISIFSGVVVGYGQREKDSPRSNRATSDSSPQLRSSSAYAEVLLRKTELEADLESFLVEYTDDFPKVKQSRFELGLISKESERLLAVKAADAVKLTEALGKLIVRKVELQRDLWILQQQFGDAHPDVKRAKRKVEIYENAIKEILG